MKQAEAVPYRLLEADDVHSFGDVDNGNMLIQGDNLDALKALLPYYAGQVKCIFIDPPYNTRSAFEHYDDNLEHSQWLGMMFPRLRLLRELLSEDGSIWVTVDDNEAHNNKSPLSLEVLQRVKAACVVEFTATPAADSNVLHNVSATELKAEEMIKLPIRLSSYNTWEEAVHDSILNRQRLHDLAAKETDSIRPIVLFQAEEKGKEITKEVLLKHLMEQERFLRKIAVVTGDQKELDGIDFFIA